MRRPGSAWLHGLEFGRFGTDLPLDAELTAMPFLRGALRGGSQQKDQENDTDHERGQPRELEDDDGRQCPELAARCCLEILAFRALGPCGVEVFGDSS